MNYTVSACQLAIDSCFDAAGTFQPQRLAANQQHACDLIRSAWREHGSSLYVLPQFSIHGFSMGRSVDDWCQASSRIPGVETERFGALARELGVYVAGTLFEVIDAFPGRHFLTGFLIAPSGEVILKYRKLYAFSTKTRPGDVYSAYVGAFGREALFPVVATPLGRLGMAIAGDVNWPEMTRALALRGAEVILNPTGAVLAPGERDTATPSVRSVRAWENGCYVVLANAGPLGAVVQEDSAHLPSAVFDYEGRTLATAGGAAECVVTAAIDLGALRAHRARPMRNFLAQLQPGLHASDYAEAQLWPLDHWRERPVGNPLEFFDVERETWQRMYRSGRFEGGA